MVGKKDYYQLLEVKRDATPKDIKQAYRRLARKYHPDLNQGDKASEAKFKEINEAYEVLSDPEKRKKYDQFGEQWMYADQFAAPGGGVHENFGGGMGGPATFDFRGFSAEGAGLDDILGEIFSDFTTGRARASRTPHPHRGRDIEYPVEITLEEAYHGTTRLIQLQSGPRLEVKLPAGVSSGSRIRLAGKGESGLSGGIPGNLYVIVSVKPHERFERKGDDLHTEISVPLFIIVLGGEVTVPTLKGNISLKIPATTQNGQTFRLAGQGMLRMNTKSGANHPNYGALYVRLKVILPTHLTEQERKLFQELSHLQAA